jgi:hypothetical protein
MHDVRVAKDDALKLREESIGKNTAKTTFWLGQTPQHWNALSNLARFLR